MVECFFDRGREPGFRPSNQDYGVLGTSRSFPGGGFHLSGLKTAPINGKPPVMTNLEDGVAGLGILDTPDISGGGCHEYHRVPAHSNSDSQNTVGGKPLESRLFSSYTQGTGSSSCEEAPEAPHVAFHLVSKLLDDESITAMDNATASHQEDEDSVSPSSSSDHALPSPSALASSWPGVPDMVNPFPRLGSSMDNYTGLSPWTMVANGSATQDVSQPNGYSSTGYLFLYGPDGKVPGVPPSVQPLSPMSHGNYATMSAEQGPHSSHAGPSPHKAPPSAPVPVQPHGKKNGYHQSGNSGPSAPRNISGKSATRRQKGHSHAKSRGSRSTDSYPGQDMGGSLPSNLTSNAMAPSEHSNGGSRHGQGETCDASSRPSGQQRKRRPHTEMRKCSPAVQHVYDLVEKANEQLASLDTQRKDVEQSLNRLCPSRRTANNPSIRMPPNPSPADRVIVEQLREHAKVDSLLSRIDRARSTPLHSNVGSTVDSWLSCLNELQSLRRQQRQKQPKRGQSLSDSDAADLTQLLSNLNAVAGDVESALSGAFKSSFDETGPRTLSDSSQTFSLRGVS